MLAAEERKEDPKITFCKRHILDHIGEQSASLGEEYSAVAAPGDLWPLWCQKKPKKNISTISGLNSIFEANLQPRSIGENFGGLSKTESKVHDQILNVGSSGRLNTLDTVDAMWPGKAVAQQTQAGTGLQEAENERRELPASNHFVGKVQSGPQVEG